MGSNHEQCCCCSRGLQGAACLCMYDKDYQIRLAQAHISSGATKINSTGTKLITLHNNNNNNNNKKDFYNKRITFVSKITLNNKYAEKTNV